MNNYTPQEILEALEEYGSERKAAEALGIPRTTMRRRIGREGGSECADGLEFEPVVSEDVPVEELWRRKGEDFRRIRQHADEQFLRRVKVLADGPIVLWAFGDPHVDNNGTNTDLLLEHSDTIRETQHVFACSAGDQTDNWPDKMARLYAPSSTTQSDAWRLSEDFFRRVGDKWLFVIAGNHDVWSGDRDPLRWMLRNLGAPYQPHGARVELKFPRGHGVILNARHDFGGSSIWNPVHGLMKAAQRGWCDHVFLAGHKHISGYGTVRHPDQSTGITGGRISHCVRVAGYKEVDDYAMKGGYPDHAYGPGVAIVMNPLAQKEEQLVHIFWDLNEGIDWMQHLRRKYGV